MSVQEIEHAIVQLPKQELHQLLAWLEQHHQELWDAQIENDLEAGRLDGVLAEVEGEYEAGLARPL